MRKLTFSWLKRGGRRRSCQHAAQLSSTLVSLLDHSVEAYSVALCFSSLDCCWGGFGELASTALFFLFFFFLIKGILYKADSSFRMNLEVVILFL